MPTPSPQHAPGGQRSSVVTVTAGSRLHFGLFAFGRSGGRQYGGAGLMLETPRTLVRLTPARRLEVSGPRASRVAEAVAAWMRHRGADEQPQCAIEVMESPPQHIGLGSGTQLACAVAAALAEFYGRPLTDANRLAAASGRGRRSAIGAHGFLRGGLVIDNGKHEQQVLGELLARRDFPRRWPVLLFWPRRLDDCSGMSGAAERRAFERMPAVSPAREAELRELALGEMLPAVEAADFERFGEAVHRYNRLAGECYRTLQGDAYASGAVRRLIERLRQSGIAGAGQSSWGPLVFAFARSQAEAEAARQLAAEEADGDWTVHVTRAAAGGADVSPAASDAEAPAD